MNNFTLGIVIKTLGAGAAYGALATLGGNMERFKLKTATARREQQQLGETVKTLGAQGRNVDQLSQAYKRLGSAIALAKVHTQQLLNAQRDQARHAAAIGQLKNDAIGAAALAAPVLGAVVKTARFDDAIKDIAIVGELSGAAEKQLGGSLRSVAVGVNQTAIDMAKGVGLLMANGMDAGKATQQAALLGKFTTATRASFDDAARMMVSFDLLGVSAKDMQLAFSQAAKAGKLGSFEVRDMARWFPQLGGYMKGLGVVGNEAVVNMASRLQIAMKTAGGTDEAANNLRNFLAKLTSPDTAKDFEKLGIDLQGSMLRMARQGLDPIEGAVSLVMSKLAVQSPAVARELQALSAELAGMKDPAQRAAELQRRSAMLEALGQRAGLGTMFQDMQAVGYLMAELQNRSELKKIQAQTGSGKNADGRLTLDVDFARRMASPLEQFKQLRLQVDELAMKIGDALSPALAGVVGGLAGLLKGVNTMATRFPGLFAGLAQAVAALALLKTGSLAARLAFHGFGWAMAGVTARFAMLKSAFDFVKLSLLGATGLVARLGAGLVWAGRTAMVAGRFLLGGLATGLRVAGQAVLLLGRALLLLGRALLLNPIGLTLTAIAGAAFLIWRNWDRIGPMLGGVWAGMKGGFASAWTWLSSLPARMLTMGGQVVQGLIDGIRAKLGAAGDAIKGLGSTVVSGLKGLLGIHSPSTVFAQLGGFVAEGFAGGIGAGLSAVRKGAGALAAAALVGLPAGAAVQPLALPALQRLPEAVKAGDLPAINGTGSAVKPGAQAAPQAGMTVSFAPVIHLGAGAPAQAGAQVREAMALSFAEFERLMRRYNQQQARVNP
ncbi:phage tail tape measure protein [Rhodoferax sp.]|uniref:phage tail tape measure protein n=1 Tax=Rhodoferax sp. TaxID=50421 RepID=UPI002602E739|nr:phage tail tape measure protein [Rhodoferax sp.]MDD3938075.1 phage tail tape measure protein [Rhodoferax sp.]